MVYTAHSLIPSFPTEHCQGKESWLSVASSTTSRNETKEVLFGLGLCSVFSVKQSKVGRTLLGSTDKLAPGNVSNSIGSGLSAWHKRNSSFPTEDARSNSRREATGNGCLKFLALCPPQASPHPSLCAHVSKSSGHPVSRRNTLLAFWLSPPLSIQVLAKTCDRMQKDYQERSQAAVYSNCLKESGCVQSHACTC